MGQKVKFPLIGRHKTVVDFKIHLAGINPDIPCDEALLSGGANPLAQPLRLFGHTLHNRFVIHPMEGWDAEADGNPGPLTVRRWQNFGRSGAALIWGGEAVAVHRDGRANPHQLVAAPHTQKGLENLRLALLKTHGESVGGPPPVVGLQLTHSGRFCRPNQKDKLEPRTACAHPVLDRRFGVDPAAAVLRDEEVEQLIQDFVSAAVLAQRAGYDFVDVKHCHGYLLHEFLGARSRPGPYGGSFENRTRPLRQIVAGIREKAPGLGIGVRLSAVDVVAYRKDAEGDPVGVPEDVPPGAGDWGFGVSAADPTRVDTTEAHAFLSLLEELAVPVVNISVGSPYYNPHLQRPAAYPPSDGYLPPEDPLVGVARQIALVRELKQQHPGLLVVSSGLTYLQQFLPHVAQALVREGWTDLVGLGRMVLSYPHLPVDALAGREPDGKLVCRTFSDCTTAPRNGLVSGCYPLDHFYKAMPEAGALRAAKRGQV